MTTIEKENTRTSSICQPLILAFVSLGLLIATSASSLQNKSLKLYLLLATILIASIISVALETRIKHKYQDDAALLHYVERGLRLTRTSRVLIIAPTVSLAILLFVRLLFTDHFLTIPVYLDFGPKHGDPDRPNIAFTGGSSFGHWIQGFIATFFAYPAVNEVCARLFRPKPLVLSPPRHWFLLLAEFASSFFTVYPLYNFVKRVMRSPDTFATSSYMNNGCEWAFGGLVGISLGMLFTSMTKKSIVKALKGTNEKSDGDDTISYPFAKIQGGSGCFARLFLGFAQMVGFFFLLSVFGAAILTGITWNNCEDDDTECANFDTDLPSTGLLVGLVLIPTVVCGVAMCWTCN